MDENDLPTVSGNEAAFLFAFGRLATLLDRHGVIPAAAIADDLEEHVGSMPAEAAPLLLLLARAVRGPRFGVIDGGRGDDEPE